MQNGSVIATSAAGGSTSSWTRCPSGAGQEEGCAERGNLSPKLVVPAVAAATVIGAAAVVLTRRRRRSVSQAPVPACATRFEEALRAYVEAGQSADLTPATVVSSDELDELKVWSDEGNAVQVSLEELEPLLRLVINHTPALAAAYSVELDTAGSDDSDGVVVQLRDICGCRSASWVPPDPGLPAPGVGGLVARAHRWP
jgi:hypothetical protein